MKRSRIWIILGGLVALAVLFLFVNFHLSFNQNRVSRNSVTTSIGEEQAAALQQRDNLLVIVEGKGGLVGALQQSARAQISAAGIINPVITEAVEPGNTNPVLLIKIAERNVFWTPVFGTSNVQVLAGFNSSGDLEKIQNLPLKSTNMNGANTMMSGEYKLKSSS